MADLYDRLEEIQGMTRILGEDVTYLRPLLGELNIQVAPSTADESNRRSYVRAIFALIEAVVEQHKRLLLDLAERGSVSIAPAERLALSERTYVVKDNGAVVEKDQFLSFARKIKLVYRTAAVAFNQTLRVQVGGHHWDAFLKATQIRDRITHPKTFHECHPDEDDIAEVETSHDWFRTLSNEFVRVAREHRQAHQW